MPNSYTTTAHKDDKDGSASSKDFSAGSEYEGVASCLGRLIAKRSSTGSSSRSEDWSTFCFLSTAADDDETATVLLSASLAKAVASRSKICRTQILITYSTHSRKSKHYLHEVYPQTE